VRGARAAAAAAHRLGERVDVDVVFLPMLPSDDRDAAQRAAAGLHGVERAWWDAGKDLATAWSAPLGLPDGGPAWDVYLVFGPAASWSEPAPTPEVWWHQLHGAPPERRAGRALADDLVKAAEELIPKR
jgi:hypothetical protein